VTAPRIAAVTVATASYLPRVHALAASLGRHEPSIALTATIVDGHGGGRAGGARTQPLEEAAPTLAARLRAAYEPPALAMAAKASAMRHALDAGADRVVLLDADLLVLADLGPLVHAPGDVVVVPHLLGPARGPGAEAAELRLLQAGVMNAGVVAASNTPPGREFVAWWEDRLVQACRHDLAAGVHYDQRWLDLAPGLFEGVTVLRDPGIDVAYWNLHERSRPWRLFHFSGFDPACPERATKYVPGLSVADLGEAAASLFRGYAALLAAIEA
jgi:hypothetical protein